MFRNILLPLDLSPAHDRILDAAAELGTQHGAQLWLLHVIEIVPGLDEDEIGDFYAGLRERAQDLLEQHAKQLESRGLGVCQEIRVGKRGREILSYARDEGIDLIMLTSHAVNPDVPGWGVGTISHQVALAAPCSVLLIRAD
jgi:nucleotide-binding universal stress UspA family protein